MKTNAMALKKLQMFSIFLMMSVFSAAVFASPVDQEKASSVAKAFVNAEKVRWQQRPETTPARFGTKQVAAAVHTYSTAGVKEVKADDGITAAYVAELEPEGFVIISADDEIEPVLGFSFQGQFPFAESGYNALLHLVKWDTAGRLKALKEAKAKGVEMKLSNAAIQKWTTYSSAVRTNQYEPLSSQPLTQTRWPPDRDGWITNFWNQNYPYNLSCPYMSQNDHRTSLVGCTAIAFGQIINYWQYPTSVYFDPSVDRYKSWGSILNGSSPFTIDDDHLQRGFPSFTNLNSSLANIAYPLTAYSPQIGNFCFAVGVKLQTCYGNPSGADTAKAATVYLNHFAYGSARVKSGLLNVWSGDVITQVIQNLKNENGWPVQIQIRTPALTLPWQASTHSVIVDGYQSDGYFHINLGWGLIKGITTSNTWYNLPNVDTTQFDGWNFSVVNAVVYDIAPYKGWGQVGSDVSNSFRTVYSGPTAAINKWSVSDASMPIGSAISGLVVGTGNRIYAAVNPPNASGYPDIFTIDRYGTKSRIGLPDHGYTLSSPALMSDGTVCAVGAYTWSSSYPSVYLYKMQPGTVQYTRTQILSLAQPNFGALRIDSQNLLYFTDTYHLYCFSSSGSQYWSPFTFPHNAQLINDTKAPAVDVSRNKIYVTYYDVNSGTAYLGCVNRTTGQLITEVPFSNVPLNRISVPSIGPDGTVYVGVGTKLYALNPDNNLASKWGPIDPSGGTGFINQPPAIGSDGTLYLAYWKTIIGTDYIAFGAFNGQNGANNWEVHVAPSGDYDIGSRGYVTQGGTVYFWRYVHNGVSQLYAYQDNGTSATNLFNQSYSGAQIGGFGPGGTMYVTSGATINAVAGGTVGDPDDAGMGFADNQPPNQPTLVAPADGSTGLSSNSVTLSWQCNDPVGHGLSYNLSICALIPDQEAAFVPITNGLANTSFTVTSLQPGITYLWKVVASDGQAITEGPVWAFTVQSTNSPPANTNSASLGIVKTGEVSAGAPATVGLSPDNSKLYAALWEDTPTSRVLQYSLPDLTLLQTITFGSYHTHGDVVVSADGNRIFTPNYYYSTVSQIELTNGNAETDLSTIQTWPGDIDITPDRTKVLVAVGRDGQPYDENNDGIAIYDISNGNFTNLAFVTFNDEPRGHKIGFSADSQFAYIVTSPRKSASAQLYEVSLQAPYQVTRTLAFDGADLEGVACHGDDVFVSDAATSNLWAVSRSSWTKTSYNLTNAPGTLAMHPSGQYLFALLPAAESVEALDINSMQVVGRYDGLQSEPYDLEFNNAGTKMYLAHHNPTGSIYTFDLVLPSFVTNGLVAYYPFNGNANDASGNGNIGTVYNASWVPDRFGSRNASCWFYGVDSSSYVNVSPASSLYFPDQISISAWCVVEGDGIAGPRLVCVDTLVGTNDSGSYQLTFRTNPRQFAFTLSDGSQGMDATWQGPIPNGQWFHLVATATRTNANLYVNGVLAGSNSSSGLSEFSQTTRLNIGRMAHAGWDAFDGVIDDVRLYNRILSPSEVQQLYHSEQPPSAPPPLLLCRFGSMVWQNTNGFSLMLQGPTGSNFVIQASTDLFNWAPLTNLIIGNSPFYFSDPAATNFPSRFYRAVIQ